MMVILLVAIVAAISVFEIMRMAKNRQIKEIIVFIVIAVFALAMGIYYITAPHDRSLIYYAFKFLGWIFDGNGTVCYLMIKKYR